VINFGWFGLKKIVVRGSRRRRAWRRGGGEGELVTEGFQTGGDHGVKQLSQLKKLLIRKEVGLFDFGRHVNEMKAPKMLRT
jgi:hypothetical protein